MTVWTPRLVEAQLAAAADTMRRLPAVRVPGHYGAWPAIVRDRFEISGFAEGPSKRAPASPSDVTAMEETLLWLRCLDRDDQKLVWARADGQPWKAIAWQYGIHRSTAHNRYRSALVAVAATLNSGPHLSRHREARQTNEPSL